MNAITRIGKTQGGVSQILINFDKDNSLSQVSEEIEELVKAEVFKMQL